jgi:hypothetical protein
MLLEEAERWWCPRSGGNSRWGGMLIGVVGSERKSRSKPPARIFISVSFSGVMSFTVVEFVSIVVQRDGGERVQLLKRNLE